jgi:hypothetical protein
MKLDIDGVVLSTMAEILQPQLQTLGEKALDALAAEARKTTDDPLALFAVDLAAGWVKEHGLDEAQARLADLVHGLQRSDLSATLDRMDAAEATQLADLYQSAEAKSRRQTRESMRRLGAVLGNFGRYAGRAFLVTVVA